MNLVYDIVKKVLQKKVLSRNRKWKCIFNMKKFALSAVTLLAAVTLSACTPSENVVTLEGGEITRDEFYEAMKDTVGEKTLQRLVLIEVLDNEVGDNNFAAEAEADARTSMDSVGGEAQFIGLLQQIGFSSIRDYQDQVHLNLLMDEALTQRTPITDEELAEYYETYQPAITASHILVEDEKLAQDLIDQINDGADFAELAKEHSTDSGNDQAPGSAQNGGSLGLVSQGQMVAPFEEAAFALEEGEMTQTPVESQFGYHIILVTEKPEKGTLEDETETLRDVMRTAKLKDADYLDTTIQAIFKDANIEIHDKDLEDVMNAYLGITEEPETDSSESDTSETESDADAEAESGSAE